MKEIFKNENGIILVDDFGSYLIKFNNGNLEIQNTLERAINTLNDKKYL